MLWKLQNYIRACLCKNVQNGTKVIYFHLKFHISVFCSVKAATCSVFWCFAVGLFLLDFPKCIFFSRFKYCLVHILSHHFNSFSSFLSLRWTMTNDVQDFYKQFRIFTRTFGRIREQISETRDAVEGFHLLQNSYKLCRGFQQGMEVRTTCFMSFIKLLFSCKQRERRCFIAL